MTFIDELIAVTNKRTSEAFGLTTNTLRSRHRPAHRSQDRRDQPPAHLRYSIIALMLCRPGFAEMRIPTANKLLLDGRAFSVCSSACVNSPREHADAPRQQSQIETRADRDNWLQMHRKRESLEQFRPAALTVSLADAKRPHRRLRTSCRYRLRGRVPRPHVHAHQAVVN